MIDGFAQKVFRHQKNFSEKFVNHLKPHFYAKTQLLSSFSLHFSVTGSDCRNKLLFSQCAASISMFQQICSSRERPCNRKRKLRIPT